MSIVSGHFVMYSCETKHKKPESMMNYDASEGLDECAWMCKVCNVSTHLNKKSSYHMLLVHTEKQCLFCL